MDDDENENENNQQISLTTAIFIILIIITVSLIVGTLGYYIFARNEWIDAFHNAALVMTSTGLTTTIDTTEGKIFSSIYNILTVILVLGVLGFIIVSVLREDF